MGGNARAAGLVAAVALAAVTVRDAPPAADPVARPVPGIEPRYGAETNTSPGGTDASIELSVLVGDYFETRSAAYGGKYLDPADGDLVVLVTGDVERHRRALAALRREGDPRVVVELTEHPLGDLARVVDAVMDRSAELSARGVEVTGGGPDEVANRARIMLLRDTPYARRAVLALLSPRDAAMVAFEEGAFATTR